MVESTQQTSIDEEVVPILHSEVDPKKMININIGVLGHIDSGKTSLCKALSTVASTASFDKSSQSKERGITLDLGFSAFVVDCPGHASLMKTVIGGASIIDLMILVVDCQKLIQTQTAECIVLGEILMDKLIVAFNKIDIIQSDDKKYKTQLARLTKQIGATKFGPETQIVPVAAHTASEVEGQSGGSIGIQDLIKAVLQQVEIPDREKGTNKDFLFAVDHCFQIKGQGTVLTGTCLAGKAKVGDIVELPALKQDKKIKSMQMFRKSVQVIKQGDRAGMCVAQLDASTVERGIVAKPRSIKTSDLAIAIVRRVPYFMGDVKTKAKFHISMGHQTAIGQVTFFSCPSEEDSIASAQNFNKNSLKSIDSKIDFNFSTQYMSEDLLPKQRKQQKQEEESKDQSAPALRTYYALIKLEKETLAQEQTLLIGSKLDTDTAVKTCRLSFYGQVLKLFPANQPPAERVQMLETLSIIKEKEKSGKIDKVVDGQNLHIRDLFAKETDPVIFIGLEVTITKLGGQKGKIMGTFGKSGKLKVRMEEPIDVARIEGDDGDVKALVGSEVLLRYKKNMMKKQANRFK